MAVQFVDAVLFLFLLGLNELLASTSEICEFGVDRVQVPDKCLILVVGFVCSLLFVRFGLLLCHLKLRDVQLYQLSQNEAIEKDLNEMR